MRGLAVDIADLAAVENATKATIGRFGKIDILINNAAIVGPNAPTWEYPPRPFAMSSMWGCGRVYCCRAVVPHMIAANYGRIVNLSSVAGKEGNPKAPAYSATRGGRDRAYQVARQGARRLQYRRQLCDAGRGEDHARYEPGPGVFGDDRRGNRRGRMLKPQEAALMIWSACQRRDILSPPARPSICPAAGLLSSGGKKRTVSSVHRRGSIGRRRVE